MSEVKIKPLADRVVVKPLEAEEKTVSGIIIPDSAQERPQGAVVVAVGSGTEEIKKGDKVLYAKFAGTEVNLDGEDYLILNQSEILAVI